MYPILSVPVISQMGPGANGHRNDCGGVGLGLLQAYGLAKEVTVDQFYDQVDPTADIGLRAGDIQIVMAKYGLRTEFLPGITLGQLYQYLADNRPIMALIHYAPLVDHSLTEFTNFRLAHWVLVIGIDTFNVYIIDPDRDDGRIIAVPIKIWMQAWQDARLDGTPPNPACSAIVPLVPIQDLGVGSASASTKWVTKNISYVRSSPKIPEKGEKSNLTGIIKKDAEVWITQFVGNRLQWGEMVGGLYIHKDNLMSG